MSAINGHCKRSTNTNTAHLSGISLYHSQYILLYINYMITVYTERYNNEK